MTTMGTRHYERRPLLLFVILSTILLVSVSQGAPASSSSLEDVSGDADDLPEYRLHPRPPLYRYFISNKGSSSSSRSSSRRDSLNSVYASPAQDIVLDSPVPVPEEKKAAELPAPASLSYPATPPPFAPELSKDSLSTQESGGLGPFSLLDQLQPTLW